MAIDKPPLPLIAQPLVVPRAPTRESRSRWMFLSAGVGVLLAWSLVYASLQPLAAWVMHELLGLGRGTHLAGSVEFFLYDAPKVLLLLALVVFAVGIVRSFSSDSCSTS